MQFLMKNCVKYFDSFVTISNLKPNLSYIKMISTKSSTNGESFTQLERVYCNDRRNSMESPCSFSDVQVWISINCWYYLAFTKTIHCHFGIVIKTKGFLSAKNYLLTLVKCVYIVDTKLLLNEINRRFHYTARLRYLLITVATAIH